MFRRVLFSFASIVGLSALLVGAVATGRSVAEANSHNGGQEVSCESAYGSLYAKLSGFTASHPERRIVAFGYELGVRGFADARHLDTVGFCIVHESVR